METIVCNASNDKIQDETMSNNLEEKGLMHAPTGAGEMIQKNEILEKSKDEKAIMQSITKEETIGVVENKSPNAANNISQKPLSPTLIEHAFNVVKNIFSPEKNRSRPPSALTSVSQQRCASGSPRNSVFLSSRSEFSSPEVHTDLSRQIAINEHSLKGDLPDLDSATFASNGSNQDSHNNTNDSFLTTVSLIEESFQSAVTHLGDNTETLNSLGDDSDIFNNSRNLHSLDPNNESLWGSECGPENTTLKNGSFTSIEGNIHYSPNDVITEASVNSSAVNLIRVEEGLVVANEDENNRCDPCISVSDIAGVDANEKPVENVTGLILEKSDDIIRLCQPLTQELKTVDSCLNESNDKCPGISTLKQTDLEKTEKTLEFETADDKNLPDSDSKNCSPTDECSDKNSTVTSKSEESEIVPDNSNSTTTIVLGETDSDLRLALSSLKLTEEDNENDPPKHREVYDVPSPKTFKEFSPFKTAKAINDANINKLNAETDGWGVKKESRSGGSTPNKSNKSNRSKLNKSIDSVTRKNLYNSPNGRKNFRQKLAEEFAWNKGNVECSENSFFAGEHAGLLKNAETVNEGGDKIKDPLPVGNSSSVLCMTEDFSSLSSQQSYTILTLSDNNLKRPVINSVENIQADSATICASNSPSYTVHKDVEVRKTLSDLTNDFSNSATEAGILIPVAKQSTPDLGGKESKKILSAGEIRNFPPTSPYLADEKVLGHRSSPRIPELEFSPVVPAEEKRMLFIQSVEKQTPSSPSNESYVTHFKEQNENLNKTLDFLEGHKRDRTFDLKFGASEKAEASDFASSAPDDLAKINETFKTKASNPPSGKMNETFDLEKERTQVAGKLNETFDFKSCGEVAKILNKTFDLQPSIEGPRKMNETFEKKPDTLNETYEVKPQSPRPSKLDQTFEKKGGNGTPLVAETDEKQVSGDSNFSQEEKTNPRESSSTTVIDSNFLKGETSETPTGIKENLNSSVISTTSSNASLLCDANLTVLRNDRSSEMGSNVGDEMSPLGTIEDGVDLEEWSDTLSRPPSADEPDRATDEFLDSNSFVKEGKVQCDADLVQFIQEQFTTRDIEKICSVVDDFSKSGSSTETPKSILVQEEFVDGNFKPMESEEIAEGKIMNPLSPQSFDFLNSVGGKQTGRDWSRESLYVKFDPLVQTPGMNSLIDFTKEVEAFECPDSLPANDTVVEHLLTISPQKKPDEIVPPLTPFSQRNRNKSQEDKAERLKELQNEIYFLKNLHAERERTNKSKMENLENQITKLTGQSCILEGKLKESSEREKSLVKKLQEQKQDVAQLKTIMEEYVKVITKLTAELENLRSENENRLTSLVAEKESYVTHLQNTEAAFSDVHAKYEKSKSTIVNLKANEAKFKQTMAEQTRKMEECRERAREAQEKASREIEKLQEELNEANAQHSQEKARLKAQLRKTELKLEAMQESLDQKIKENVQLTAICDELIEGRK